MLPFFLYQGRSKRACWSWIDLDHSKRSSILFTIPGPLETGLAWSTSVFGRVWSGPVGLIESCKVWRKPVTTSRSDRAPAHARPTRIYQIRQEPACLLQDCLFGSVRRRRKNNMKHSTFRFVPVPGSVRSGSVPPVAPAASTPPSLGLGPVTLSSQCIHPRVTVRVPWWD